MSGSVNGEMHGVTKRRVKIIKGGAVWCGGKSWGGVV